jgi:hypothetical protein
MANNEEFTTVRRNFTKQNKQNQRDNNVQSNLNVVTNRYNRVVVRSTQSRRKSSRTLLLKEVYDREFKYEGLQNIDKSPHGNVFLVFDTLENSRKAFKDLRINKVNCKYSYYKLFFKSSNLDTTKNYDNLKSSFLSLLSDKVADINVLYFKYYRRDGLFTGSGDFVVDRKLDCDILVTKRILTFEQNEFTFYRFRANRGNLDRLKHNTDNPNQQDCGNSEEEVFQE